MIRAEIVAGLPTLLVAYGLLVGPSASAHVPSPDKSAVTCRCPEIEEGTGWCTACETGFVSSVEVPSASLFEMIDPHGHDLDPEGIPCPTCLQALEADTFCESCGIGYVEGRAYVSRLAFLLARGEPGDSRVLQTEFGRLQRAVDRLSECELCGVASYVDGRCPKCRIHYRDGNPVTDRQNQKD